VTASSAALLRGIPSLTGTAPAIDLAALPPQPETLFFAWLAEALAAGVREPVATTLATVDADGMPDARTVILKDLDDRGWAVAGLSSSEKGRQLDANPVAALAFWWQPVMRAVRVRGTVEPAGRAESDADLAARSPAARADVAPGDWTLWRIRATRVEFWQGSTDRRHLRIVYAADTDGPRVVRGEDGAVAGR
jgi:pyridoxamine 5'-phosphate oxidase